MQRICGSKIEPCSFTYPVQLPSLPQTVHSSLYYLSASNTSKGPVFHVFSSYPAFMLGKKSKQAKHSEISKIKKLKSAIIFFMSEANMHVHLSVPVSTLILSMY